MTFSLVQSLFDTPLAVIDVETTGMSADFGDRVTELGIVRIERGQVVGAYQQLIDPCRRISPGVAALTGITQEMVDGQPTFAQQLPAAMPFLSGAVVVGHNVRFDLSFLASEFRRGGRELVAALGPAPVLDTVRIARRRFGPRGNGLQRLAARLGVAPVVAHRALADAQTTAAVFERLIEPVGHWSACLFDAMREQGGPMGLTPASQRESLLPVELAEAMEQGTPVRMEYLDAGLNRTQRVIQPLHIRRAAGELLLVAHCHLRGEQRTFKVERIVRLVRIESPQAPQELESSHGQEQTPLTTVVPAAAPPDATGLQIAVDPGPDRFPPIHSGSLR